MGAAPSFDTRATIEFRPGGWHDAESARRWPWVLLFVICSLILVAATAALCGCADIVVRENNGPVGDAEARVTPRFPHPFAERSSRRVTTRADGTTESECDACEGGTCPNQSPPK